MPLITQDLVLVGGGHSHAIVLRMWGMQPLPGIRLTLLTDNSETPYSGMLPGHVAGFYSREDCHIDLRSLCQFAGAQLLIDRAVGLDLTNQRLLCAQRPPIAFDALSIDIGSTPQIPDLPDGIGQSITAKPVPQFLQWWDRVCDRLTQPVGLRTQPFTLAIIGGGAGGVELALTMHHRLQQMSYPFTLHLLHRTAELLPRHNAWVRRYLQQLLLDRGVQLHRSEQVIATPRGQVICASGLTIACDETVWVTQATAPSWLRAAGLAVTPVGFVQVNDYLQSISHPQVFAAGDVATMVNYDRPKAGVFAVRQGRPLFKNLQAALQGKPLQAYHPQAQWLSLIGTADGSAVATRGFWGGQSRLLWRWKDHIDRAFMRRFNQLPEMEQVRSDQGSHGAQGQELTAQMRCLGCGAKVGSSTLQSALTRILSQSASSPPPLISLAAPDDAAVLQIPTGQVLVQTIDYFPALISDPYVFGQIAANHSLSDLYAMGATPHSALAIATVPYGTAAIQAETLYQLLAGAIKVLQAAQAELIGGHTTEGATLAFGLSCNGFAVADRLLRKGGMQPGERLILTKPLGTGTLFAAAMRGRARARWIDQAIASMLISNQAAATCFLQHHASACTDITGFGLLGHLGEMVRASGVAVCLDRAAIPILPGARETVQQGILSSLHPQNWQASELLHDRIAASQFPDYPLLFDPQTAGGLLAAIPPDQVDACLVRLKAVGYADSAVIGQVAPLTLGIAPITIR
jgi:selenide, water dikinase